MKKIEKKYQADKENLSAEQKTRRDNLDKKHAEIRAKYGMQLSKLILGRVMDQNTLIFG